MRKQRKRAACLAAAAAVAAVLASGYWAAAQQKAEADKTLEITGSTTVYPIAEAFAEALRKARPGLKITVKDPGSGPGATALIEGRCQIATLSRFMKPEEFKLAVEKGVLPTAHAVAMDGVCVIVHPSNPLRDLSVAQVHDLYTGKTANWKDLGGPDKPVVVISRDTSSGTYEAFTHFVMGKDKMIDKVEYVAANSNAHDRVATTDGAVAYVGLGFLDAKVKALAIGNVAPSRKTIVSGAYPLSRPLYLFTNGYPELGTAAHAFCTFFLTEKGQEIVEAKGFVSLTAY